MSVHNITYIGIHNRPCKTFITLSLITMQNVVVVSHTMCTHVGGDTGAAHLGAGAWLRYRNSPFSHIDRLPMTSY